METIDLGIQELDSVQINLNDNNDSGGDLTGIELLMNDNVKKVTSNKIEVGDLNKLEDELNDLSQIDLKIEEPIKNNETETLGGLGSNIFKINEDNNVSGLGTATADTIGNTNTWDGFTKINDIPNTENNRYLPKLSDREMRRKKRHMIKKLEEWSDKGLIKNYSNFTLDSNFDEIEDEYETAVEDKRKKDSVKLQGWWFTTLISSLEYANTAFDPFGLNLDGWGEQITEDLDSYEEIFGELHEKYKGGKMAPELNLLLRIGFSAAVTNFTNKALSSSVPGFNDVIRQSPELMKAFTNATVNSMSQQSPGFAFANSMMQEETMKRNQRGPPPPAPVKTRESEAPIRPGQMAFTENISMRPDLSAARGGEEGISLNGFSNVNEPPVKRPEMKGPSNNNIDQILSGLKTKNINLQEEKQNDTTSVVSVNSLTDLTNETLPKGTKKRKQKSDKNTISLDI